MINPNDTIRHTNVVARKYRFHYKDFDENLTDFMNDIVAQNLTIKGPLFYSINNVPMDEIMNVEFFMPIHEDRVEGMENTYFHSYFNIENMISICVHTNVEVNTEVGYRLLLDYMETKHLQQVTPVFHILSGDRTFQYVFIKMGTAPIPMDQVWK